MQRPVWLLSMDSEQFDAPPTTTAALWSYYRRYGRRADRTRFELQHFATAEAIEPWLAQWLPEARQRVAEALAAAEQPVLGFSMYTWNAAQFLALARRLRRELPGLLLIAGGPHVQQAEDYLGEEAIDVVFLGEAELSLQEFLDCESPRQWPEVAGLAFLRGDAVHRTAQRARVSDLSQLPSPLEVLQLTHDDGSPRYRSIAYETSRGCPFQCAFCEWGTGAIGSRMYQWPIERIRQDWHRIVEAGIENIWLADSNFGALKQDLDKARIIVELKQRHGLPLSFATSWSKKHSRQVQEIALLLHQNRLLPHYQLALQTLTPEALRLSNRQNMSSNEYEPIAKHMSEQGVPIAAELIWGLPGDNLPQFEQNLDTLLATFPNINIFGYTLLPGTEFYRRREEYRIEAVPVAGYGKAHGEYVVGCHSFDRNQGEEGYFLITAHILLVHGHIMPLTTRLLALRGVVPVSKLLRDALRAVLDEADLRPDGLDPSQRLAVYEARDAIYLRALGAPDRLYPLLRAVLRRHCAASGVDAGEALRTLQLDAALAPRAGHERREQVDFDFDPSPLTQALEAMELPPDTEQSTGDWRAQVRHPGGLGDILLVADGGSWLRGVIEHSAQQPTSSAVETIAIA